MSNNSAFTPTYATVNISAGSTTANVALGNSAGDAVDVRVCNHCTVAIFINFGASSVTASASTSMPIAAGGVEILSFGPSVTHMAAITASASNQAIYATAGQGV